MDVTWGGNVIIFQESVYVGTEDSVMRVPAQHCGRLHSRVACQNSMDPYCGWNELKEQCTTAPNHDALSGYWKQSVTQCPVLIDPGECRALNVNCPYTWRAVSYILNIYRHGLFQLQELKLFFSLLVICFCGILIVPDTFWYFPPIHTWLSLVVSSHWIIWQKFCMHF